MPGGAEESNEKFSPVNHSRGQDFYPLILEYEALMLTYDRVLQQHSQCFRFG
jgi:hypothetical protein